MKLEIFVKIFTKANNFLTSADIQKNQIIMIRRITWKICGGPKNSFVGLKAKMYTFTTEMEHDPTNDSTKRKLWMLSKQKVLIKIFESNNKLNKIIKYFAQWVIYELWNE